MKDIKDRLLAHGFRECGTSGDMWKQGNVTLFLLNNRPNLVSAWVGGTRVVPTYIPLDDALAAIAAFKLTRQTS